MAARAGPLLDQIRRDAAAAADERRTAAAAQVAEIRREAEQRTLRSRADALADRARSHGAALEAVRAEATQRVTKATLAERAAALQRVFTSAAAILPSLSMHPRLGEVLGASFARALSYLPDGPVTARTPGSMVEAVRLAIRGCGREGVTVRADETVGTGAILESGDGTVSVDVTFAGLIDRDRARLAISILREMERPAS